MNPDSENFDQLRRLFALKRHEQPPPGYFDRFSRDVISRIQAGEQGDASTEANWMQRLWLMLEAKPLFAGAFGAGVCALLMLGILSSEEAAQFGSDPSLNPVAQANNPFATTGSSTMALNQGTADSVLSTNPAASLNSLFDFHLTAQPASYNVVNGN
ncbi:MAG: hypothetical protein ACTHLW_07835 [Verrucomicrobiota bacterium]